MAEERKIIITDFFGIGKMSQNVDDGALFLIALVIVGGAVGVAAAFNGAFTHTGNQNPGPKENSAQIAPQKTNSQTTGMHFKSGGQKVAMVVAPRGRGITQYMHMPNL